jgi:YfiH family protein
MAIRADDQARGDTPLPEPFEPWHDHLTVTLPGARVVFTTRRGGFSVGAYESLNLGRLTDDSPHDVARNRRRVQDQIGRPLAMVRQVHGSTIHLADDSWPTLGGPEPVSLPEGDGVMTLERGRAPAVLVADCLPVAIASPDGVVAMLHAGWRGLAAGILEEGARMVRLQGGRGQLQAAIGPGVGVCCYEVGEEVQRAFASYGAEVVRGRNLDLAAVARAQLARAGIEHAHDIGLCTYCHPELFFSHRRDRGVTGRQAGVVWSS